MDWYYIFRLFSIVMLIHLLPGQQSLFLCIERGSGIENMTAIADADTAGNGEGPGIVYIHQPALDTGIHPPPVSTQQGAAQIVFW
jgi:hypothetical protein